MNKSIDKPCNCNQQIIWWFNEDKGTILACMECEITFHYTAEICPYCKEEVVEFTQKENI